MNFLAGTRRDRDESVKELDALLFDDMIQVLSNFELNQMASLTYGELVCDSMFETFECVFSQPMRFTPVTLQKGLVICKHVLVYGSGKCVNSAYGIGKYIDELRNFNTVLMAQKQQGARAVLHRLQGGGVDRGGPVREAAEAVAKLLSNIHQLQHIRNTHADPTSLVPVGDRKPAFVSDDVRHYLLQKRMEEQQRISIRSNLAKADGGFGGGYNASDGKNVVGAAHGIEEMLKMVKKEKQKFTDDNPSSNSFSDYRAPDDIAVLEELAAQQRAEQHRASAASADLLADTPQPQHGTDLLSFQDPAPPQRLGHSSSANVDLLGISSPSAASHDPFAPAVTAPSESQHQQQSAVDDDLLGVFTTSQQAQQQKQLPMSASAQSVDPFDAASLHYLDNTSTASSMNGTANGTNNTSKALVPVMNGLSPVSNPGNALSTPMNAMPKSTVMQSSIGLGSDDPFKALESLTISETKQHIASFQSSIAKHRILSGTSQQQSSHNHLKLMPAAEATPTMVPPPTAAPPPPIEDTVVQYTPGPSVAQTYGEQDDESDNSWMMGGTSGSGLGLPPPPSVPPPPPPSS